MRVSRGGMKWFSGPVYLQSQEYLRMTVALRLAQDRVRLSPPDLQTQQQHADDGNCGGDASEQEDLPWRPAETQ